VTSATRLRFARLALRAGLLGSTFSLASLAAATETAAPIATLPWARSFSAALEQARVEHKMVMVDFYTTWCGWCKVLDRKTFADANVIAKAGALVSVKVNGESDVATAKKYGVRAYPTILFLAPDGEARYGVQGFRPPEEFGPILEQIAAQRDELDRWGGEVDRSPRAAVLRRKYASTLALARDFTGAIAQLDTLLLLEDVPRELQIDAELDRAGIRLLAGDSDLAREEVDRWLRIARPHEREVEAEFLLARTEAAQGRSREAEAAFQRVIQRAPTTWFAEQARLALETKPGPKGT